MEPIPNVAWVTENLKLDSPVPREKKILIMFYKRNTIRK